MKLSHTILPLIAAGLMLPCSANELPPSDVTPYDLLSPHEHAEMYLNLLTIIRTELIPLQDSVRDAAGAAAVAGRIEALHSRLNLAVNHMRHNPDTRREVARILEANPHRAKAYKELSIRFFSSLKRCRETGLISGREFNRMPIEQPQ